MQPLLYRDLVPWYRLLTPINEYEIEAGCYRSIFERAVKGPKTLLELGTGAGHNAYYLKRDLACTLTDLSPEMLGLSREINPECEHHVGDMRTIRLGQKFDTVLVHDAVMYMTTEDDVLAAARTAFEHTKPGGAALFTPDFVTETFGESSDVYGTTEGSRGMRCMEWTWDPDPTDTTYVVDYAFFLREGVEMKAVYDRHVEGLFPRAKWLELLAKAGFEPSMVERDHGYGIDEVFLAKRPA